MVTETLAPVAAPVEPITRIKPSEALRLGRLTRPRRITGAFFDGDDGACAVGAMIEGFGGNAFRLPLSRATAAIIAANNDLGIWGDDETVAWLEARGL